MKWQILIVASAILIGTHARGDDLVATIAPEKPRFVLGEPIFLAFRVSNRTDRDLFVQNGGDYRNRLSRPESYSITVLDGSGTKLDIIDVGSSFGGMVSLEKVPAKDAWERKLSLSQWVHLTKPGSYLVQCDKELKIYPNADFTGEARSETVHTMNVIVVSPADPHEMRRVINEYAQQMLQGADAESSLAMRRLVLIDDSQVIPILVQAIETKRYELYVPALDRLSQFKAECAVDGIAKALKLTTTARHMAVGALARSAHPKALDVLLTLQDDKFDCVRLDVLRAASKSERPDAVALVQHMTQDRCEEVRCAARVYLGQREAQQRAAFRANHPSTLPSYGWPSLLWLRQLTRMFG